MGSIRETLKYAHIDLLWASLEDACKDINMNNTNKKMYISLNPHGGQKKSLLKKIKRNEWIKNYCLRKTELNEWLDSVLIRFLFFLKVTENLNYKSWKIGSGQFVISLKI